MTGRLPLIVAVAISVPSIALPQTLNPSAREILNTDRPLLPGEIAIVLEAARRAVDGKVVHVSAVPGGPGPDVLLGPDGRPRFVRGVTGEGSSDGGHVDIITFTDYTRLPARSCDGSPLDGALVVEYEHRSSDDRWTVKARTQTLLEPLSPLFDMLAGGAIGSGGLKQFGDRSARALVAPFKPPPGVQDSDQPPPGMVWSLWIDTETMRPLRGSIAVPANPDRGSPAIPDYGFSFTYENPVELQPPPGVTAPDCVPAPGPVRPFRR